MLQDTVSRFAADRCDLASRPTHVIPSTGRDAANWQFLADLGLLALPFDESFGGMGGQAGDLIVVMEAIGRSLIPEPYLAEIILGGLALARAGGDAAQIGAVVAGTRHVAFAWAEHASRQHWDRPATKVAGDRLSGAKTFVLAGDDVDAYIVVARESADSLGLYQVDAAARGVRRRDYRLIDGSTAQEIEFRDVAATRLAGGDMLATLFDDARLAASAEMLGIMEMLFAVTLDYLRTREQFGVPIGSFQAIQHRMADLYARLQQSRSLLYRAIAVDPGERAAAVAATSAYVGSAAIDLAEQCVQYHGGMGVSEETIVGHGLCRIMLLGNLFGSPSDELARYAALSAG